MCIPSKFLCRLVTHWRSYIILNAADAQHVWHQFETVTSRQMFTSSHSWRLASSSTQSLLAKTAIHASTLEATHVVAYRCSSVCRCPHWICSCRWRYRRSMRHMHYRLCKHPTVAYRPTSRATDSSCEPVLPLGRTGSKPPVPATLK